MNRFYPSAVRSAATQNVPQIKLLHCWNSERYTQRTDGDTTMSNLLHELFPINGRVFESPTGKWRAELTKDPEPLVGSDRLLFDLSFHNIDDERVATRRLRLWTSDAGLHTRKEYVPQLFNFILSRLSMTNAIEEETEFFGR